MTNLRPFRASIFCIALLSSVAAFAAYDAPTLIYDTNSGAASIPAASNADAAPTNQGDATAPASSPQKPPKPLVLAIEGDADDPTDAQTVPDAQPDLQSDSPSDEQIEAAQGPAPTRAIDVLIDMRHAHDFSDFPLTVDDRNYHRIYSFNKAFEYLKSQGVVVEKYESNEPLTPEILAQCKTLFLNLPSGDKEPFFVGEILAIRDFIQQGGALFLITDHTNCYFHQSRLAPLFHEIDIEPQYYGVCDTESAVGTGEGWLFMNRFADHPVTRGLREIAFQTGGGVDPRFAVAWSSETSWQDAPGIPIYGEADLAYYGNFAPDPGERVGASGVVLAREYGKGRVVIVGDQNLFSAFYLQYLDVYRLWLNAFAWTLDRPELADRTRYAQEAQKSRVLICWEDLRPGARRFGDPDANGYYHIYTVLCRHFNPFCVAHADTEARGKAILFVGGSADYQQEGFDFALQSLERGDAVVFVDPESDALTNSEKEPCALANALLAKGVKARPNVEDSSREKLIERVEFENGAKIVLIRGRHGYNNEVVPQPERRPLLMDQENINAFLAEIDSLFDEEDFSLDDETPTDEAPIDEAPDEAPTEE